MTAKIYKFPKREAQLEPAGFIMFKDWDTGEWVSVTIDDFKAGKHTKHRSILTLGKEDV